jgi:RHS repeat-associated protein
MWSASITGMDIRQGKHVYVGQTRVATRLNYKDHPDTGYEQANTYYYHPDHLGSAQLVTDPDGQEYERIEYTPYGELWVEKTREGIEMIPFRFTGKELDAETGLYYYGARYLDPKTSVWLSADPALGEYVPGAPIDEEARKRNGNLPGMGGVYNTVNLHLYHYAGNNPLKFTDPTGMSDWEYSFNQEAMITQDDATMEFGYDQPVDGSKDMTVSNLGQGGYVEFKGPGGVSVKISKEGIFNLDSMFSTATKQWQEEAKKKSETKERLIGAGEMVAGAVFMFGGAVTAIGSEGGASKEGGQAVVLGVQLFGIGIAQTVTGKHIMNPLDLFTPPITSVIKDIPDIRQAGVLK